MNRYIDRPAVNTLAARDEMNDILSRRLSLRNA
jgi:hypothetical protein